MTSDLPSLRARLDELATLATPGPLCVKQDYVCTREGGYGGTTPMQDIVSTNGTPIARVTIYSTLADADYLVACANAWPTISLALSRLEQLEAVVRAAKELKRAAQNIARNTYSDVVLGSNYVRIHRADWDRLVELAKDGENG